MLITITDYSGYGWKRVVRAPNDMGYPRDDRDRAWYVSETAEAELHRIASRWIEQGGSWAGDTLINEHGGHYLVDIFSDGAWSCIDFRPEPTEEDEEWNSYVSGDYYPESTREIVVTPATREDIEKVWRDTRPRRLESIDLASPNPERLTY